MNEKKGQIVKNKQKTKQNNKTEATRQLVLRGRKNDYLRSKL
jgi:hypothetical protein